MFFPNTIPGVPWRVALPEAWCNHRVLLFATLLAQSVAVLGGADEIGATCLDCHQDVVRSYRETGMARALQPLGKRDLALLPSLEPVAEPHSEFRYHFEVEGVAARIVESRASQGSPVRLGDAELRFAIGAGLWDRSFAAARDGQLWLAPLEVLTREDGEHRSVLAPAHEHSPGSRFQVPIRRTCLRCHTDRLPELEFPPNREPRDWTPRGISCAACHGAVAAHVGWQEASLTGAERPGADPVATSRTMGRIERVSVCARCHLQGDARIVLTAAGADLPPVGADLLTHVGIWGGPSATSDIGFVSQVERLVRSRCFTATAEWGKRAMSCESCHNPHRTSREPQERVRVRAACVNCHAERNGTQPVGPPCSGMPAATPRGADCVGCHMRLTPVFDLSGIRIHDHRIVARPPAPSHFERSRAVQATSVLERFAWPDAKPPLSGDPGLELMALSGLGWFGAALEWVDAVPAPEVRAMPEYHFARGKLLEGREMARVSSGLLPDRSQMEKAGLAYGRALMLLPNAVEVTMRLVPVLAYLGRTDEALARIDEVIALCPDAAAPLSVRALVHLARRDPRTAVRDHEAAHAKAPSAQGARELAELYLGMGDAAAAAHWRAEAARLEASKQ